MNEDYGNAWKVAIVLWLVLIAFLLALVICGLVAIIVLS